MAKRDGNAARARRQDPARPDKTELKAVDGDASTPMALDRLIHERVRLALVSALAVNESLNLLRRGGREELL